MDFVKFDDFTKLDIRVVTITDAQPIEGADKLILLTVDDGTPQPRSIVAGIKKYFALCPESQAQLVNSQVIIIANLEPRKIKGITSHGMILAASDETGLQLVSPRHYIKPGTKVG